MSALPLPSPASQEDDLQHRHSIRLFATFVGGALILNSYLAGWLLEGDLAEEERIVSALCGGMGALFLAAPLWVRAARSLWAGHIDMGELAALAILACFATGKYQEAGLVAFFLMLAELLESRTALGAHAAVEGLIRLAPRTAHLLRRDSTSSAHEEDVPVETLQPGSLIRIRPGEVVPVDGIIREGETSLNEASITGESLPVDRYRGDTVFAGSINLTGMITVEVTTVGADTTLGKVSRLILQAEATRLPIMRLMDQYAHWYTPTMLIVAAMILYFTGKMDLAITALVVACPCALVLATPTAMMAGLTCAARLGILIKNVAHLESAGSIRAVVFDKTGTLTTGELTVTRLAPAPGVDPADLLRIAASADRHSNHPAARAILRVAREAKVSLEEVEDVIEHGGRGIVARIRDEEIRVGKREWIESAGISLPEGLELPSTSEAEGYSTVYVAKGRECLGWIGFMDRTRPEARKASEELLELGVHHITMLTGDRWGAARRVAAELGCTDVLAECLPERKLAWVEEMKKKGWTVAVVGDGVNDAPALAAGDLGIAMGAAGNDIAIHSASIALLSNDLRRLPFLIRLSRKTRRVIWINLLIGAFFVIGGLIAAGMGWLAWPWVAALLHNLSSLLVIFHSARLVRYGEEFEPHLGL